MKNTTLLCTCVCLLVCLGCSSIQRVDSSGSDWEVRTDVTNLPEILKAVFDELGITLERSNKQAGRYTYIGSSQSGEKVTIKAIALVRGRSYLSVNVRGDSIVTSPLLEAINETLRRRITEAVSLTENE